ncbi:MAG: L-2-amino-thiazoline-4-carboxylic acid hydrolase [Anaerolineae bacterium]|nr:L-2-amino-thiazoline-4-carboxylic acid hydrolase [Anaerolineae bacterium]
MRRFWKLAAVLIVAVLGVVVFRMIATRRKQTGADYYLARQRRLLHEFDRIVRHVRHVVDSRYGMLSADTMIADARREYETLIPQIPYIGGKQPFTQYLIYTALYVALFRAMRTAGMSIDDTGKLLFEATRHYLDRFPRFVYRIVGRAFFSESYVEDVQRDAEESQARKYPGDWVYEFVPGDDGNFDYGVNYTECAACKFLAAQDALEIAPYLCLIDRLYSERLGWGLKRTTTLAEGGPRCDFRFKRGGDTQIASTVLPETEVIA